MTNKVDLFSPLKIRGVALRNRIGVSPMCMYSSRDGFANDFHLVHLGARALGGAGMVMMEATAISPEGRISPGDMGIWKDDHIENLARITGFLRDHGATPAIQLAHAGRKASTLPPWKGRRYIDVDEGGWRPLLAPSALPYFEGAPTPQALDQAGIQRIIQAFQSGARRALDAGFQIIEVHAAHGYLLHEFLSPLSNHRDDEYGGSFDNRTRLLREVCQRIREVWPDELPLFVRISATDWLARGWDLEQSVELSRQLKELGVDLIDCSSGAIVPDAPIPTGPGYQVDFAAQIREQIGIATAAVGRITSAKQAQAIVENAQADLVLLGRQLLRSPHWPLYAARELGAHIDWPLQYLRGQENWTNS